MVRLARQLAAISLRGQHGRGTFTRQPGRPFAFCGQSIPEGAAAANPRGHLAILVHYACGKTKNGGLVEAKILGTLRPDARKSGKRALRRAANSRASRAPESGLVFPLFGERRAKAPAITSVQNGRYPPRYSSAGSTARCDRR